MALRERLGIHLFVWGADWHDPRFDLPRVLDACRRFGFASVEVPWLTAVPAAGVAAAARAIAAAGLWATVSTALPPRGCLVDPARAEAGVAWLERAADAAAAFGSPVLCGPVLAPVGELPTGAARPWAAATEALSRAAGRASALGVRLCVEPLNRYENDVLNSLGDGAELCRALGGRIALLADTYHQNIEEADPVGALRGHLAHVGHVHLSENHRGPVGSGHICWADVVGTLDAGGYAGRAVVEGFNGRLPALAQATCIWHPRADSPEEYVATSAAALGELFR